MVFWKLFPFFFAARISVFLVPLTSVDETTFQTDRHMKNGPQWYYSSVASFAGFDPGKSYAIMMSTENWKKNSPWLPYWLVTSLIFDFWNKRDTLQIHSTGMYTIHTVHSFRVVLIKTLRSARICAQRWLLLSNSDTKFKFHRRKKTR